MQRFTIVLFALVALFATVVPSSSASALSHVKRETNAARFARGLPPLPPTRRETARRHEKSQASVPRSGRVQVRDHDHGNSHGYIQNGPSGPHGINHGGDPDYSDLTVIYNSVQNSIFCLGAHFSGNGFYLGAAVSTEILSIHSTAHVSLINVEIGITTAEAGIWTIGPDGKLTAVWVNIDGSTVPVGCAYHDVDNALVLVGDIDGFISLNAGWVKVDIYIVD